MRTRLCLKRVCVRLDDRVGFGRGYETPGGIQVRRIFLVGLPDVLDQPVVKEYANGDGLSGFARGEILLELFDPLRKFLVLGAMRG